tara:strand:- start:1386 stop:1820 length:435 start_codon:yes stop_codon:yes gene_type:complete
MSLYKTLYSQSNDGGGSGESEFFEEQNSTTVKIKNDYQTLELPDVKVSGNIIVTSDERLKDNIKDLTNDDIDKLTTITPKQYNMKFSEGEHYGFIAQEVEKIYPSLVHTNEEGYKSLNYIEFIPLLLLKIKDLEKQVTILQNKQ